MWDGSQELATHAVATNQYSKGEWVESSDTFGS